MQGVQTADGQGHAVVKLPPHPTVERQHREAGNRDVPEFARQFPVQPQPVQEHENGRKKIEAELMVLVELALLERLRHLDVDNRVRTDTAHLACHVRTRNQTHEHQQRQDYPALEKRCLLATSLRSSHEEIRTACRDGLSRQTDWSENIYQMAGK